MDNTMPSTKLIEKWLGRDYEMVWRRESMGKRLHCSVFVSTKSWQKPECKNGAQNDSMSRFIGTMKSSFNGQVHTCHYIQLRRKGDGQKMFATLNCSFCAAFASNLSIALAHPQEFTGTTTSSEISFTSPYPISWRNVPWYEVGCPQASSCSRTLYAFAKFSSYAWHGI